MFRLITSGACQVLPSSVCHQTLYDCRMRGPVWSCPSCLQSGYHLLFPLLQLFFGGSPHPPPPLRASGAHVPHSWQVLCLSCLPPHAAGYCSSGSPHFMQICSDCFQTWQFKLICVKMRRLPGCQCPRTLLGLPVRGVWWLANWSPRKASPEVETPFR